MQTSKRVYHPLVIYFYYSGMLSEGHLQEIPYTTRNYWDKNKQELLFGYDWVKEFSADHKNFHTLSKHRVIFQTARICCRIISSFSILFSQTRGYAGILKKNKKIVVETVDRISETIHLENACRIFRITTRQFNRWKNEVFCSASVLNHCFKVHPRQLALKEVVVIKEAVNSMLNQFKPKATAFYELLRSEKLACSLTTFYKYAKITNEQPGKTKLQGNHISIRANRIFEYLHIDTTWIRTEKGKRRVAFVKDNFSKVILGYAILPNGKSEFIRNLLMHVFAKFDLFNSNRPINIVSDGGPENKGDAIAWINGLSFMNVKKLIAGLDFPSTNAMSESTHHLLKAFFAPGKIYVDDYELRKGLESFVLFANHNWFPVEFFGSSPIEVMSSGFIDRNKFSVKIKDAQKLRVIENRNFKGCCKFK